jgi:hypothetical protein
MVRQQLYLENEEDNQHDPYAVVVRVTVKVPSPDFKLLDTFQ